MKGANCDRSALREVAKRLVGEYPERVARYMAETAKVGRSWYDEEGNWVAQSLPAETRERFWLCFSLYANGESDLANAVICKMHEVRRDQASQNFSIFIPNTACALLMQHGDRMNKEARDIAERLVEDAFGFYPGNRQPDFQFHGYNDNMPAKATLGLILGGELLGNRDAVEYGMWNLRQLRAMLVRRGINSEFHSPTYSPLTMHAIAEVAKYARNEEARDLARKIEARLWLDLAARFHPELGSVAGPYARAYTVDTLASMSLVSALLWFHFGDRIHPSPMELFTLPKDMVIHHAGDVPFNIAQFSWIAAGHFRIPEEALPLFIEKTYPFHVRAGYEVGGSDLDFPGREGCATTCLQRDYTVGTATTPMGAGEQTLSYFVTYRRRKNIKSFRDMGTVYTKMVVGDHLPGMLSTPGGDIVENCQSTDGFFGEADLLASQANTITLQDEGSAMVLTHPHLSLADVDKEKGVPPAIHALSEMVIFPSHFGGAEELYVGGTAREDWDGEAKHGEWIVARRGQLLIGIRPMVYTRSLGPVRITLEKCNRYEVIRFTFYRGQPRTFQREELREVFGGFVAEHASVEDYASLKDFALFLSKTEFTDYFWITRRVRYRRPANASGKSTDMEVSWTPGSCLTRYSMINGKLVGVPVVEIEGVEPSNIPFLTDTFKPVPGFFPWKDFKNIWYDIPYAIGDRESFAGEEKNHRCTRIDTDKA